MHRKLYFIFVVFTSIAFIAATEVNLVTFKALLFYKAYNLATQMWLSAMDWLWLLILLFLWLKRNLAIIPLVLTTYDTFLFSLQVLLYNAWPNNFTLICNHIAAAAAIIMLISGYLYYFTLIYQNRSKIKAWFEERF